MRPATTPLAAARAPGVTPTEVPGGGTADITIAPDGRGTYYTALDALERTGTQPSVAEVSRTTASGTTTTRVEHFALLSPSGEALGVYIATGIGFTYYHKDLLGSVRAVTLPGWTVMEARTYDAWGVALAGRGGLGSATREGFTGKVRDTESTLGGTSGGVATGVASGLDYFGARTYAPAFGRFLQVDPLGGKMPSWSPYAYAFDDPARTTDPDGRCPNCVTGAVGAGLELGVQLTILRMQGNTWSQAFNQVDWLDVGIAGAAAAVAPQFVGGEMIGGMAGRLAAAGTLNVATGLAQASGSVNMAGGSVQVNIGRPSGYGVGDVAVDAALGMGGEFVGAIASARALASPSARSLQRAERVATNILADGRARPAQIFRAQRATQSLAAFRNAQHGQFLISPTTAVLGGAFDFWGSSRIYEGGQLPEVVVYSDR